MRSHDEVAAMSCPVCRVPLAMSDRQGIEIDYCPQCRGVWLDRGELDKIVERSGPPQQAPAAPPPQPAYREPAYDQRSHGHSGYGKPRKHKHWLSEIFD